MAISKILKRNGRMVAEQSGQPDFWVLTGDYHLPQSEHSSAVESLPHQ
ncbi:hypothetical protein [Klebsiella quasipneumoniae]